MLLGRAAEAAGDDEAAAAAWRKTLRIAPDNADALVRLADLCRRTGRAAEAREAVADLASWSRDADAALRLAVHYARSNERGKALEQAGIAVRSRPDDTALLEKVAGLQAWLGDREAAVATLELLLAASPGRHEARLSAGAHLREMGRTDDALRQYRAVIDALPRAGEAYVQGALALAAVGRTAEALAFLEPGLELLPRWPRLVYHRGLLRDRSGDAAGAERDFRETLHLDSKHAGAANALGYLYTRQGVKLEEAVALIEGALQADPGNPGYLDSLGWAHYRRGDKHLALAKLGQALGKRRDDALIREHLAEVCRSLEDPGGAPQCHEPASAPPSPVAPSSAP